MKTWLFRIVIMLLAVIGTVSIGKSIYRFYKPSIELPLSLILNLSEGMYHTSARTDKEIQLVLGQLNSNASRDPARVNQSYEKAILIDSLFDIIDKSIDSIQNKLVSELNIRNIDSLYSILNHNQDITFNFKESDLAALHHKYCEGINAVREKVIDYQFSEAERELFPDSSDMLIADFVNASYSKNCLPSYLLFLEKIKLLTRESELSIVKTILSNSNTSICRLQVIHAQCFPGKLRIFEGDTIRGDILLLPYNFPSSYRIYFGKLKDDLPFYGNKCYLQTSENPVLNPSLRSNSIGLNGYKILADKIGVKKISGAVAEISPIGVKVYYPFETEYEVIGKCK